MKKLILILVVLAMAFFTIQAFAADRVFSIGWEVYQEDLPTLAKFTLMYGTTKGGPYPNAIDIAYDGSAGPYTALETIPVPDGKNTTFYFIMLETDKYDVVSPPSNEASATVTFPKGVFNLVVNIEVKK